MSKHPIPPFAEYWANLSPKAKQSLVARSGISYKRLSHLANGHSRAGLDALVSLCNADKKLSVAMLRPDLGGKIK